MERRIGKYRDIIKYIYAYNTIMTNYDELIWDIFYINILVKIPFFTTQHLCNKNTKIILLLPIFPVSRCHFASFKKTISIVRRPPRWRYISGRPALKRSSNDRHTTCHTALDYKTGPLSEQIHTRKDQNAACIRQLPHTASPCQQ